MIIVVEGPSAAGKTTYARAAGDAFVAENASLVLPPRASEEQVAAFWADANAHRWSVALETERQLGFAVCDTDPLKLHYGFCLYRVGRARRQAVAAGVDACRRRIEHRMLGMADLVVCSIPSAETLRSQKDGDVTRSRHNFQLHAQLGEPLAEWYAALERCDPGRVVWGFPGELPRASARSRYDLRLFDQWMSTLELT